MQFRPAQAGDRIDVQAGLRGTIHVTAQLDDRGSLVTPGGQFALSDSAKLKKWVADLQGGGVEGIGQPRTVFGFTREQLDQARQSLAAPVGFATKGVAAAKALDQIRAGLKVKVTVDPAIERPWRPTIRCAMNWKAWPAARRWRRLPGRLAACSYRVLSMEILNFN